MKYLKPINQNIQDANFKKTIDVNYQTIDDFLASLTNQIENIVSPPSGGDPIVELTNARVGYDGKPYLTLKSRLDTEIKAAMDKFGLYATVTALTTVETNLKASITAVEEVQTGLTQSITTMIADAKKDIYEKVDEKLKDKQDKIADTGWIAVLSGSGFTTSPIKPLMYRRQGNQVWWKGGGKFTTAGGTAFLRLDRKFCPWDQVRSDLFVQNSDIFTQFFLMIEGNGNCYPIYNSTAGKSDVWFDGFSYFVD